MVLCDRPRKEERPMKLMNHEWFRAGRLTGMLSMAVCLMGMALGVMSQAQTISTTTVQGTLYQANGQPSAGTLMVSWPSFTTASGQMVVAGSTTVTIAPDGFVSVNLAPNLGATPAGLYYTAVYYLSNGTTNTQYWVVPAAAQATLGQIQSQLMPAAQAVQAVSKSYVDQAIASLAGGTLAVSGTTMTGPLILCCDPTQPLEAADKHYVDENVALDVPLNGGTMTGALTATKIGGLYQVDQFSGADFGAKLSACLSGLSSTNGGICDARNFTGTLSMGSSVTMSTANATVLLPCATISTSNQLIVTAGTRNVSLRGCSLRGASTASGSQGGTVFLYSGTGAMIQVGDPTYAADTLGFHVDNVAINITGSTSATAQGLVAYRTQELDLESLYFLGNSNQTGITLDGTGNYTGGSFEDNELTGFQTAVNAIGHQIANAATTDWMNASTFVRLHIDCPTSNGSPIAGTYGINLQQGDGNTFTGGDVEGCATALHLGANAQNNTIDGLRNENSTNQVIADAGSSYNNWMTGGTMFTGQLTDNGTRNSFLDTFHRSFNGLNGDWYGSQKDATVTNHYRLGIGQGNERGLLNEIQTDYGYRWLEGYTDATAGEQFYQVEDLLNNVNRLSIGQYNSGQSSTNNQTVINSAGTGAVVLNGSNHSGTGGVVIGSGGASETTVATIGSTGNAQFTGTLQVNGTSQSGGTMTVRNNADSEVDYYLWPGLTSSQKGSYTYKDWNGNSQWYMVKDQYNNWALNSATGGLDSFKAYQSTNTGDTYIGTSNSTGSIRMNYEPGSSSSTVIYAGGSTPIASFTGTTSIKFPGLAAASGHFCLQIDSSGYITNTGAACGSGSGGGSGTVNTGTSGQIAYYGATGTAVSGTSTVPIGAGGTGASTATGALANLGGVALTGGTLSGALTAPQFNGPVTGNLTGNVSGNLTGNVTGNVSGTASNVTGTVQVANGGTGANTAAGALANLGGVALSGGTLSGALTAPQFNGPVTGNLTGNVSGNLTGNVTGNVSGTASNVTGTVQVANGGTGANTAAGALANLGGVALSGGTLSGALTAPQFNGPVTGNLTGNVSGNLTGNVTGNVSGTASNVTGTVQVANGGTGANTAAGAVANLLPGVSSTGGNGVTVLGNTLLNGTLNVGGASTFAGSTTISNQADAEIDSILQAGLTTSQKESFSYEDWNGSAQWTMAKDQYNNWALNSATGGLDSFKAYQSANGGDTYIDAANASGVVRINYESGSGTQFKVYGGNNGIPYASLTGATSIQFPGLSATSGYSCLQIDNSGFISNTGAACGTGSMNGTINAGTSGQIAYYSGNGTAISGASTVSVTAGGTGASTALGALGNLGGAALAGAGFTGPVSIASTLSVENNVSIGPRFDVTNSAFGAKGDGTTDDTAAIQAAFNTCANYVSSTGTLTGIYGGIVEFPGQHSYVISSTINAYDGCQIEGTVGSSSGSYSPPRIFWNGPTAGTVYAITGFTAAANTTPLYAPSSPAPHPQANLATLTVSGGSVPAVGSWVDIEGLSTSAGANLNKVVAQVAAASGSSFTVVFPSVITPGTFTDSGTATSIDVMVAFDSNARYEESIKNIMLADLSSLLNSYQVGFYFGSRVDTGTRVDHAEVAGASLYGYYFAGGGINVDFDKGWRSDGSGVAGIYWRVGGGDSFGIANGTTDNGRGQYGASTSGAAVMLDNSACNGTGAVRLTARNVKHEINTTMSSGLGVYTMLDCPTNANGEQFYLDFENVWMAPGTVTNSPGILMSPANDMALNLNIVNGSVSGGGGLGGKWVGLPALARGDLSGVDGIMPLLSYSPPFSSDGGGTTALAYAAAPTQILSDLNIEQLYQYGIRASDFLYSDTAFAALANGTTLYAGQIVAPPAYWSGANGNRYAIDVVYQTGTTGSPNGGATTCTGSSGAYVLTCTSATDLSAGQRITIGTDANKAITFIDATHPGAVIVHLVTSLASNYSTATALSFSTPVLGPEIQMPTKSPSAPASLAWSQGDMEQNSAATANGVAAWVNVAAGTPGTWAGIPLGNSSGQITASQIASASLQGTDAKLLTAGTVSGTASPLCTDGNGGATTAGCTQATNTPAWLMNLGTGADGSYEYSSTGSCTTSPTHCVVNCTSAAPCSITLGEMYVSSFQVDSGAYVYDNMASTGNGLVIHSQGACNDFGTILVNGARSTWSSGLKGVGGGSAGGSGGGTAAGAAGVGSYYSFTQTGALYTGGGTAGAASGGNGAMGATPITLLQRAFVNGGAGGLDGLNLTGGTGVQGGSSGGAGGYPGQGFIQTCGSFNGTGGFIDASGANGMPPTANSTGAGSGGGGGVVILSSLANATAWPTVSVAGGPGGLVTVPEALATSGSCITQPKVTLGVTSGALNGSCTVVQAGAGCGTGANVKFNVVGGGGTLGTGTVNPTWSGGALASCTTTAGTSSGYTAATYTTAGTGGDGGNGWYTEFQGW